MQPLILALILGLRHAADPDHLTAVSTLVLTDKGGLARRAGTLGLAWGLGHATTLVLLGIPAILLGALLPPAMQSAAEVTVGLIIVGLAIRMLMRWRQGHFHTHPHRHEGIEHQHPHVHDSTRRHPEKHPHRHASDLGRTPLAAFGVGLVHGIGGSAGAGVLLIASIPERNLATIALGVFAGGTALAMAAASMAFGYVLSLPGVRWRIPGMIPVFGVATMAFGIWYAWGA
ncbi:MAG: hypothetical protein ACREL6_11335 [Gemmatimonadales bacterium]